MVPNASKLGIPFLLYASFLDKYNITHLFVFVKTFLFFCLQYVIILSGTFDVSVVLRSRERKEVDIDEN